MKRFLAIASAVPIAVMTLAGPASAIDTRTQATTWEQAAAQLGMAGSLWEPVRTAGLKLRGPLTVLSDNLVFANGSPTAGDTAVSGRYGTNRRGFTILEKWANTGWAADPTPSTERAPVGTVRIPLGAPGTQRVVTATIASDCVAQPKNADPKPVPRNVRCSKSDVLTHGGVLTMTARPSSTMTAPGNTSVVIESTGLSYTQLIAIARSLIQWGPGGANDGAGSAQMRAMCQQMIDGKMTLEQAQAFADSNGYGSVRAATIDGQPQALTMDYRWDRFNVDLTKGAVTGCTYG